MKRTRMNGRTTQRGTSLIELLVSLAVMSLMMIGILQLFALSLAVNKTAMARTQMTFKCQQVVENLRYFYNLLNNGRPVPAGTGIPALAVATVNLPYDSGDFFYDYWGPNGANVIEGPKGPYKISYSITNTSGGLSSHWVVTVTVVPTDDASPNVRYFGVGPASGKRVDYVAEF
jgi:hypothetical protein